MSLFRKNLMVGLTVLVALLLLGWMILRFGEAPMKLFTKTQMPIQFVTASAEGLSEGSPVSYLGVTAGRVSKVYRSRVTEADGHEKDMVVIEALLDPSPPLPANVEGRIRTQLIGGGASIRLEVVATPEEKSSRQAYLLAHPEQLLPPPEPQGVLKPNARLKAEFVGVELLPPEFSELAVGLRNAGQELQKLIQDVRRENLVPELVGTIKEVKVTVRKAGDALDQMKDVIGDQKLRDDLRQTIANFRETSESATRIGQNLEKLSQNANTRFDELAGNGNKVLTQTSAAVANANKRVDEISKQLGDRLTQLAGVLQQVELASRKLNQGNGSAAQLLNNPALYENLLDTSKELKLTISDFRRLVEQWEQEGVSFKLK